MNPMTNMKNVKKLSEQELGFSMKTSWHDQYKHSAWIFVGGLPYDLTEGDIICVFSQYGEIVNINLVRDKGTGKPRGFCFICYEDQRSTNLAVDNFNGIKLLNRTIRVDHCEGYKAPKDDKMDEQSRQLHAEGCAPGSKFGNLPQLPSSSGSNGGLDKGLDLPPMESLLSIKREKEDSSEKQKDKKEKKEKKSKKTKDKIKEIFKKKKKAESTSSSSSETSSSDAEEEKSKKRKTPKKLKRRNKKVSDTSSSSSDDSGADDRKTKSKKKTRRDLSTDSDANEKSGKSSGKSKQSLQKASKSVPSEGEESEDEKKAKCVEKTSFPKREIKDVRHKSFTDGKDERDIGKYKGDFSHKTEKDRTLSGDGNREDPRMIETQRRGRDDRRDDKRDDHDRRDNRDRRDNYGRKDDRDRREDRNREDSSRYSYERKQRDGRREDGNYKRNEVGGRR